jgi:phosphoglycolate phosphatase
MGKPPVDDDIPAEEQVRILRKLFDATTVKSQKKGHSCSRCCRYAGRAACERIAAGLVTNKPTPFVAPLLEALDIAKYLAWSSVVTTCRKKPHPEPLLLVASKLGIKPEQMLFVGDSRNDIQAAKAAGCPSAA